MNDYLARKTEEALELLNRYEEEVAAACSLVGVPVTRSVNAAETVFYHPDTSKEFIEWGRVTVEVQKDEGSTFIRVTRTISDALKAKLEAYAKGPASSGADS